MIAWHDDIERGIREIKDWQITDSQKKSLTVFLKLYGDRLQILEYDSIFFSLNFTEFSWVDESAVVV